MKLPNHHRSALRPPTSDLRLLSVWRKGPKRLRRAFPYYVRRRSRPRAESPSSGVGRIDSDDDGANADVDTGARRRSTLRQRRMPSTSGNSRGHNPELQIGGYHRVKFTRFNAPVSRRRHNLIWPTNAVNVNQEITKETRLSVLYEARDFYLTLRSRILIFLAGHETRKKPCNIGFL